MSRKTKLALEPGVELDWGNENHRRHMEDEAFAAAPWAEQPRPMMKAPERSGFWWFWRFYGLFFQVPMRDLYRWYSHSSYDANSGSVYRFKSAPKVRDWLWGHGAGKALVQMPFRYFLKRLLQDDYNCPHCGFDDYHDEHEIWNDQNERVRTINLFEMVSGGGNDYYGEANDCHGWQWCYRCGDCSWNSI